MAHLYLMESDVKVGLRENQIVITYFDNRGDARRLPIEGVDGISVFGMPQLSTQLIRECISRNIPIVYYSDDGHYFGNVSSSESIDPLRQKRQVYLTDDDSFCLDWSKRIIAAKIQNSITLLYYFERDHQFIDDELRGLHHSLAHLKYAESVDAVLGYEGNAARNYFECLPKVLRNEEFLFVGRSSRPPKDPFNSMISYGYSLLYRNIIGAIEQHGLHPYFAFMHKLKFGHAALASDLIEEFRAPLIDKAVVEMVNNEEVRASGFYRNDHGALYMDKETARIVTNRLSDIIARGHRYFLDANDSRTYGFQVALDKKMGNVLEAIERRDASLYIPYVWRPDW